MSSRFQLRCRVSTILFTFITVTLGESSAAADVASKLYWTTFVGGSGSTVQRANLDGSGVETLVTGLNAPWPIEVDPMHGKMYWGDVNTQQIQRANLDGSGVETVAVGVPIDNPAGLAIDAVSQTLYWSDFRYDKICKTDLTTHTTTTLVSGLSNPFGLALDLGAGKVYWADAGAGKIQRVNLDGTGLQDLVTGLSNPRDVDLDLASGKMFWPDLHDRVIYCANLDGSGAGVLLPSVDATFAVAVDPVGRTLYWTSDYGIGRANLDGSDVELDLVPGSSTYGLAVVPEPASALLMFGLLLTRRR